MRISDWSSDVCSSDLITLRGEINYMSLIYFTAYNQDSVAQPGNTKFNAFLGFTDKDSHWNASLFIRNITDKRTIANALVGSARSEARRVGTEGVSPCRSRGSPYNQTKTKTRE